MAKKSSIERNERCKRLAEKYKVKRQALLTIARDKSLSVEERFNASLKLAKLPRNSAPVRYRNRCMVTGRPRAFYRKLGVSRIALRELGSSGIVPGIVKSSW